MADRDWDLVKGLVIGGLIGAALGILFAPKSGKETRQDIANIADELLEKAKAEYEIVSEKGKTVYDAAVERIKDVEESAAEKLAENKNRLKKAIEAGVDAYREEKSQKPV